MDIFKLILFAVLSYLSMIGIYVMDVLLIKGEGLTPNNVVDILINALIYSIPLLLISIINFIRVRKNKKLLIKNPSGN